MSNEKNSSNVVSLVPKNSKLPEKCKALDEIAALIEELKKDDIPYNRAVVVFVSDDEDNPEKLGFRTATINAPGFTGLGMLHGGLTSLEGRLFS